MFLLIALFIVVPIAELYVIIQIGGAIGVLPTVGLLILDSVLGAALMRAQGRAAWRRFNAALAEGRMPAREVIDGALVIFGGALLLTPGFLTDLLGLILLLPPTRALVRGVLVTRFSGRLVASAARGAEGRMGRRFSSQTASPRGGGGMDGSGGRGRPRDANEDIIDADATDVDPRRPDLP